MELHIDGTSFGSITISGQRYDHDVIIRLNGKVEKRNKKLSKAVYGTSHTVSLEEMEYTYQEGASRLIVGSGQYGVLKLSQEAVEFLELKGCEFELLPTPEAIEIWNRSQESSVAIFHVTC